MSFSRSNFSEDVYSSGSNSEVKEAETASKSTLKFITWNIDGIHEENLIPRTEAVCKTILNEQADIVFLQEIVPESKKYIEKNLKGYHCVFGNNNPYAGYFIGTFLRKSTISCQKTRIIKFRTNMNRNCLKVNAFYENKKILLFNSHLESCARGAAERKLQLKQIFDEVLASPADTTAVFAGDLNTTDKELAQIGGLPVGINDLWITSGSREESKYTFDLVRNDNLVISSESKPRCRFDRVYVRHSSPRQLEPTYFGLIGTQRLIPQRCFPSDHWGILCRFQVDSSDSSQKPSKDDDTRCLLS